jgi:flagellar assembly protein FliH
MMSTSSRPDPEEQFVQQFTYPTIGLGNGSHTCADESPNALGDEAARAATFEQQAQTREAAAYGRGLAEGQQRVRAETQHRLEEAKATVSTALADFAREREQYFQDVEAEVVALSLAIARKILNREAQVDSLVLKGVVRAALERLSIGTQVHLHVSSSQAEEWRQVLDRDPVRIPLEIVEDSALTADECRIETQLGSTHLSVDAQLKEIEQGFADLLARSPRSPA